MEKKYDTENLTWFGNLPTSTAKEQQEEFHYDKRELQVHSVFHSLPKTQLHPISLSLKYLSHTLIFFLTLLEQENKRMREALNVELVGVSCEALEMAIYSQNLTDKTTIVSMVSSIPLACPWFQPLVYVHGFMCAFPCHCLHSGLSMPCHHFGLLAIYNTASNQEEQNKRIAQYKHH